MEVSSFTPVFRESPLHQSPSRIQLEQIISRRTRRDPEIHHHFLGRPAYIDLRRVQSATSFHAISASIKLSCAPKNSARPEEERVESHHCQLEEDAASGRPPLSYTQSFLCCIVNIIHLRRQSARRRRISCPLHLGTPLHCPGTLSETISCGRGLREARKRKRTTLGDSIATTQLSVQLISVAPLSSLHSSVRRDPWCYTAGELPLPARDKTTEAKAPSSSFESSPASAAGRAA